MGGEKLVAVKSKFEQDIKAIQQRAENYLRGAKEFRDLLKKTFIEAPQATELIETNSSGQMLFDWHKVKPQMQALFNDNEAVLVTAEIEREKGEVYITDVLDRLIEKSALHLHYDQEKQEYSFKPPTPYTPKAQILMQQFACALTIYRSYLKVSNLYHKMMENGVIRLYSEEEAILEKITKLKNKMTKPEYDMNSLITEITKVRAKSYNQLNRLNEREQPVIIAVHGKQEVLIQTFELFIEKLQDVYKTYPSQTWIGWLSEWQNLVNGVCTNLFSTQFFSYGSWWGSISVNRTEFFNLVYKEYAQFLLALKNEKLEYHIIFLTDVVDSLNDMEKTVRINAVHNNQKLSHVCDSSPNYRTSNNSNFFDPPPPWYVINNEVQDSEEESEEFNY